MSLSIYLLTIYLYVYLSIYLSISYLQVKPGDRPRVRHRTKVHDTTLAQLAATRNTNIGSHLRYLIKDDTKKVNVLLLFMKKCHCGSGILSLPS